jgi:hypothetical protein
MLFFFFRALRKQLGLGKLYNDLVKAFVDATEAGLVPDFVMRLGIRYLLSKRVEEVCWSS